MNDQKMHNHHFDTLNDTQRICLHFRGGARSRSSAGSSGNGNYALDSANGTQDPLAEVVIDSVNGTQDPAA